ncbi:MAG: prepilin-type N-terminal cleavage/methylation domain-containing protein [Candidatus Riflebacteria bacterium]|nr:prepilin-type N-terminal cleavage/methylation domain-containing protein [Candidatus Riflebacteria bacterium]
MNKSSGFTLIELMIIVAITAIIINNIHKTCCQLKAIYEMQSQNINEQESLADVYKLFESISSNAESYQIVSENSMIINATESIHLRISSDGKQITFDRNGSKRNFSFYKARFHGIKELEKNIIRINAIINQYSFPLILKFSKKG